MKSNEYLEEVTNQHSLKINHIVLNDERNVVLTAMLQPTGGEYSTPERPAMIICPGGGYLMCSDREAEVIAFPYLKEGYQCFVLRYSVGPDTHWPQPLEDYKQAYRMIVENADKWSVKTSKIATIGFSAGGHLAAMAAVDKELDIAAAVLVYPALLQNILALLKPDLPEPPSLVNEETSPCFIAAARDDRTVNINNTLAMQQALVEHDIPFESHIYSYGGHAFASTDAWTQFVPICSRVPNWIPDSVEWLREVIGIITPDGIKCETIEIEPSADRGVCLSACCSLKKIQQNRDEKVDDIMKEFYDSISNYAVIHNLNYDEVVEGFKKFTISEISEKIGFPIEATRQIHDRLRALNSDEDFSF